MRTLVHFGLAAALLIPSWLTATAKAEEGTPFQASGYRVHIAVEEVPGGFDVRNGMVGGKSTFGDWAGSALVQVRGNSARAAVILTFANGDSLYVSLEQHFDSDVGEYGGAIGTCKIEGGTGQFANASGHGVSAAIFLDADAEGVQIVMDGTILLNAQ
jgi:hypothetical protein